MTGYLTIINVLRATNFNVEGAVRHKTFKNFSSRNRQKLKLEDSESPLNFLYVTTIKILKKRKDGEDIKKLEKLTFANLFWYKEKLSYDPLNRFSFFQV
jgi:hypothetical protein